MRHRFPRKYRTRKDPFDEVWREIEKFLLAEKNIKSKDILDWLNIKYPGKFQPGQIRTLQRRLKDWRKKNHLEAEYSSELETEKLKNDRMHREDPI